MQSSSIKIYKTTGYVVLSNIYDRSIDKDICEKISEYKPHTLIIQNLDGNSLYYNIHKRKFKSVDKVVFFGDYRSQDTDGIYTFDKILITPKFNERYATSKCRYMTPEKTEHYKKYTDKLDEILHSSLSIATSENAKEYFDYIQKEPTFEVIDE